MGSGLLLIASKFGRRGIFKERAELEGVAANTAVYNRLRRLSIKEIVTDIDGRVSLKGQFTQK